MALLRQGEAGTSSPSFIHQPIKNSLFFKINYRNLHPWPLLVPFFFWSTETTLCLCFISALPIQVSMNLMDSSPSQVLLWDSLKSVWLPKSKDISVPRCFNVSLEFSFLVVSQLNKDLLEQLHIVSFSEGQSSISKHENPAGIQLRMNSK